MKYFRYPIYLLMLLASVACKRDLRNNNELTIPLQTYSGDEIKTNGYYYKIYQENSGDTTYEIYFLYRNGVVLHGGYSSPSEIAEDELSFANGTYYSNAQSRTNWGRFEVHGNQIRIEKWFPSSGGPAPVYMLSGSILNDTLFHLTRSRKSHDDFAERTIDYYYQFKAFSDKPDSTNDYSD